MMKLYSDKSGTPRRRAKLLSMTSRLVLALMTAPVTLGLTAVMPASAVAAEQQQSTQPNIVLIMVDDLGAAGVGSYGGEYPTPRIDQLAREGAMFTNAHATPLCTPSRTRILTGIENARNYEAFGYLNPNARTFGHVLKEAGYATAIVGKWQLSGNGFDGRVGMPPLKAGFDEALLWQVASGPAKGSRYWGPTLWKNGRTKVNESGFGPDVANTFALDFITRNKDKPFFLYYPMVLPHSPYVPTPDSMDADTAKAKFTGMVGYIDKLVGQVLDRLQELGLDKNTVVIFTGDNGTGRQIENFRNGVSIRGEKGQPTIGGTHVPMIVRWPGKVRAGSQPDGLFDFTDMLPTLSEIGHGKVGADPIDGASQVPVLTGEKDRVRDHIFMHYAPGWINEPARFVFDARWKLYGDGRFVSLDPLHDTESDVKQMTPEAKRRLKQFQEILDKAGDGPLNPLRFPMCAGKPSLKEGVAPEIAGCSRDGDSDGNE